MRLRMFPNSDDKTIIFIQTMLLHNVIVASNSGTAYSSRLPGEHKGCLKRTYRVLILKAMQKIACKIF